MQNKKQKLVVVESILKIEEMDIISSDSFTVLGCNTNPDNEIVEKLESILPRLKTKGMKFNFSNDGHDIVANRIFRKYEIFTDIYLPFSVFNKENLVSKEDDEDITPLLSEPTLKAHRIAAAYKYMKERDDEGQIRYNALHETVKKFSARDVHLVLGPKCATKVKLLIIYTNDEAETTKEIDFKTTGSASFPIKLAEIFDIPVFNLNKAGRIDDLIEYVNKL